MRQSNFFRIWKFLCFFYQVGFIRTLEEKNRLDLVEKDNSLLINNTAAALATFRAGVIIETTQGENIHKKLKNALFTLNQIISDHSCKKLQRRFNFCEQYTAICCLEAELYVLENKIDDTIEMLQTSITFLEDFVKPEPTVWYLDYLNLAKLYGTQHRLLPMLNQREFFDKAMQCYERSEEWLNTISEERQYDILVDHMAFSLQCTDQNEFITLFNSTTLPLVQRIFTLKLSFETVYYALMHAYQRLELPTFVQYVTDCYNEQAGNSKKSLPDLTSGASSSAAALFFMIQHDHFRKILVCTQSSAKIQKFDTLVTYHFNSWDTNKHQFVLSFAPSKKTNLSWLFDEAPVWYASAVGEEEKWVLAKIFLNNTNEAKEEYNKEYGWLKKCQECIYVIRLRQESAFPKMIFTYYPHTLYDRLSEGSPPFGEFSEKRMRIVGRQILAALQYFKKAKIVHLDLNLNNILLLHNLEVRIAGFSSVLTVGTSVTASCGVIGWQAPELSLANPDNPMIVDPAQDLFSFALIFYCIMWNRVLFFSDLLCKEEIQIALNQGRRPENFASYESYSNLLGSLWNGEPKARSAYLDLLSQKLNN